MLRVPRPRSDCGARKDDFQCSRNRNGRLAGTPHPGSDSKRHAAIVTCLDVARENGNNAFAIVTLCDSITDTDQPGARSTFGAKDKEHLNNFGTPDLSFPVCTLQSITCGKYGALLRAWRYFPNSLHRNGTVRYLSVPCLDQDSPQYSERAQCDQNRKNRKSFNCQNKPVHIYLFQPPS